MVLALAAGTALSAPAGRDARAQKPGAAPAGAAAAAAPAGAAAATTAPAGASAPATPADLVKLLPGADTPQGLASTLQWVVLVTVLSLAPAILVMVTSFTRIIVVLSLLRQAVAAQNVPPNQVLFGLALLMTVAVMAPVWQDVYNDSVSPLLAGKIDRRQAVEAGEAHVRKFMIRQIEAGGNTDDVYLFLPKAAAQPGRQLTWGDVTTVSLVPAFAVSELKIAFYMGFRVFLPFVIVDMLVAAVLVSMGMLMLPPVLVSLPFKLLLFVLADGWRLVVGTLMGSFG
jgi:flagellar biosynthetic protein FliP